MKSLLPLFFLFLVASSVADEKTEFDLLRERREAAAARVSAPIEERFEEELEKLIPILTTSNELDEALEVKRVLEASRKGEIGSATAAESQRLGLLLEQRSDALDRALAPIESTYLEELERLLRKATAGGKLEEAVRIRKEMEEFRKEAPEGDPGEADGEFSEKSLVGTEWELDQSGETIMLRFAADRFVVHKKGADGEWVAGGYRNWKMENAKRRQIRIFWHYGDEVATVSSRLSTIKDSKNVMRRVEE